MITEPIGFSDAPNHFINNQRFQGIVNHVGFKQSVRLPGTTAAMVINMAIAKRSYLDLRRLQQRLRRLQHYFIWTWIRRLAAYLLSLPNAQGYGISSREVSTIEPTPGILLANVYRGFGIARSDTIDNSKQARVCQRPLPVTTKHLHHSNAE